jgi:hypothetical protein
MATASYAMSFASEGAATATFIGAATGRAIINTCGDPRAARDGIELALPPGAEVRGFLISRLCRGARSLGFLGGEPRW